MLNNQRERNNINPRCLHFLPYFYALDSFKKCELIIERHHGENRQLYWFNNFYFFNDRISDASSCSTNKIHEVDPQIWPRYDKYFLMIYLIPITIIILVLQFFFKKLRSIVKESS